MTPKLDANVSSDAVGAERKTKIYFGFFEATPGVVASRSEDTRLANRRTDHGLATLP